MRLHVYVALVWQTVGNGDGRRGRERERVLDVGKPVESRVSDRHKERTRLRRHK